MDDKAPPAALDSPEWTSQVVRKHIHDARNHLYGFDIAASLIEDSSPDSQIASSLENMRAEVANLEASLRALGIRFAQPKITVIPVIDVFHLWRSRNAEATSEASVEWSCQAEDTLVALDGRMVADALGEWLRASRRCRLDASVECRDGRVIFSVRQVDIEEGSVPAALGGQLPHLDKVLERNGGHVSESSAGLQCWFPVSPEETV